MGSETQGIEPSPTAFPGTLTGNWICSGTAGLKSIHMWGAGVAGSSLSCYITTAAPLPDSVDR